MDHPVCRLRGRKRAKPGGNRPALSETDCHQAADAAWWAWGYLGAGVLVAGVGLLVAGVGLLVAGAGLLAGGLSECLASCFW